MSVFLERLRGYLERVARTPDGVPAVRLDIAAHRRRFLDALDQLPEHKRTSERVETFRRDLPQLVELLAAEIQEHLAPDASADELAELIDVAIQMELGLGRTTGSDSRDHELYDIMMGVEYDLTGPEKRPGLWNSPARYAFEIRATRRRGERHVITRAGAVLLDLPGIDAVRWLLSLEAAQTLGPDDEWRISPEFARRLLEEPHGEFDRSDLYRDRISDSSLATVQRLGAMQMLRFSQSGSYHKVNWKCSYALFDRVKPLLEEIAEQRPTPFAVLANALLRDDIANIVAAVRPAADRALHESAAAATALQARMVVHEIRNALVPARSAFLSLMEELDESVQMESLQRYQRRIREGINQALSFSENMLRVANLGMEPVAPFDLVVAIKEAIAAVAWALNGSLRYSAPEGVLQVIGPQARFIMAIANLLRNAAQAIAGREGVVEVSMEATAGRVVLRVDDDGPGVPVEQRRMIFEQGVTLRSGGSGQGLALVRQVIEGEMRGAVSCGDSPLGGARFEIVIPVVEE